MPGTLHQGILLIFQDDPWLAFDLLGIDRPIDGFPIDRRAEIERDGPQPMTVRPGYPDLVLVHRDPIDDRGIVITLEAQKDYNAEKRWDIPVYQSHLAKEHRLDTWSVVVSLDPRMSSAVRQWSTGGPPRLDVLLIDVDSVPQSPWLADPVHRPLAAVLAGALHGYAGDLDAARIGFHAARTLTGRRRLRHGMTVLAALPPEQRDMLIGELPMQEQHDWMDVERRSGTYHFGRREGRAEGRQEGRQEGLQEGLQEGARVALRELIFSCLADRQLVVDETTATQIHSCEDLETLQRLARRAMSASSLRELFE